MGAERPDRSAVHFESLIDIEWQLHSDATTADAAAVAERDAALRGPVLAALGENAAGARAKLGEVGFRQRLARTWLDELPRNQADRGPGARITRGYDTLGWLLPLAGVIAGAGAARAFTAYDGRTPVNVLAFIGFFVGLQLLLLLGVVWLVLAPRRAGRGAVGALLGRLAQGRWLDRLLASSDRSAIEAMLTLRGTRATVADAERWRLFGLAQRFGVAFNAGAIATCLYLVTFSDLAFCWSTTLDVDADTVHRIAQGLTLPWAAFAEAAVPSREIVESSQWVRLHGGFANQQSLAEAARLSTRWWQFLVASVVAYGLLPRLLTWGWAAWSHARVLRRAPCDHAGYQQLFDRLLPANVHWRGPAPESVGSQAPAAAAERTLPPRSGEQATLVLWGRLAQHEAAVRRAIERRQALAGPALRAGGIAPEPDTEVAASLASGSQARVVVAFEAGMQPTREVLGFLAEVRRHLPAGHPLLVCLLAETEAGGTFDDAEAQELAIWERSLATRGDEYLWLQPTAEPA